MYMYVEEEKKQRFNITGTHDKKNVFWWGKPGRGHDGNENGEITTTKKWINLSSVNKQICWFYYTFFFWFVV